MEHLVVIKIRTIMVTHLHLNHIWISIRMSKEMTRITICRAIACQWHMDQIIIWNLGLFVINNRRIIIKTFIITIINLNQWETWITINNNLIQMRHSQINYKHQTTINIIIITIILINHSRVKTCRINNNTSKWTHNSHLTFPFNKEMSIISHNQAWALDSITTTDRKITCWEIAHSRVLLQILFHIELMSWMR